MPGVTITHVYCVVVVGTVIDDIIINVLSIVQPPRRSPGTDKLIYVENQLLVVVGSVRKRKPVPAVIICSSGIFPVRYRYQVQPGFYVVSDRD